MSSKQLAEFSVEQADADSIIRRLIKRLSNTIPDLTLPTLNLGAGVDVMDADKAPPVEILPIMMPQKYCNDLITKNL